MILTVCLSPCIDVTVEVAALEVGKTNIANRKRIRAAGKAINVALDITRLGGEAFTTGFMYEENGEMFESLLHGNGIRHDFIMNPGRVRENYKFIDHRSMLTEVNDVGAKVSPINAAKLLDKVGELSARSNVIVISGGLPRGLEPDYYGELFRVANPRCIRIVDATEGKLSAALRAGVDLVKPNLQELQNFLGKELESEEELLDGCRELISRGAKSVLLSMGNKGAIYTDGGESYYCRSKCVAVNSTVGAGDAMVAAAAICMEKGSTMSELLRSGVAAGTAAVTTFEESEMPVEKYAEIYESLQISRLE